MEESVEAYLWDARYEKQWKWAAGCKSDNFRSRRDLFQAKRNKVISKARISLIHSLETLLFMTQQLRGAMCSVIKHLIIIWFGK